MQELHRLYFLIGSNLGGLEGPKQAFDTSRFLTVSNPLTLDQTPRSSYDFKMIAVVLGITFALRGFAHTASVRLRLLCGVIMLEKHVYCVKCQAGKTVVGKAPVVLRNGSVAMKGTCPSCESIAYKIVKKDALNQKAEAKKPAHHHLALMAFVMFAAGLALGAVLASL